MQARDGRWIITYYCLLNYFRSTSVEQLRKPIEESLKDLRRTDESLIRRLESLVIFTDNVNIPMKVKVGTQPCQHICAVLTV